MRVARSRNAARAAALRKALHDAERALKDENRDADTAHDKMKTVVAHAKEWRSDAPLESQF